MAEQPYDLVPSLREVVERERLEPDQLTVGIPTDDQGNVRIRDRHFIPVTDRQKAGLWSVPSLQQLFRGTRTPPNLERYPEEYVPHFYFIEKHVLVLCETKGDRTDQEMEETYAILRRRPDGKSLGEVHDFMWQVLALLLGTRVVSAAEYEAIISQLERSVRKWALRPISRFYVEYLHNNLQ